MLSISNYVMRRKTSAKLPKTSPEPLNQTAGSPQKPSDSALQRFEESMKIDYEKWHDGLSYDLDALKTASPTERKTVEQILINHNPRDWRDIEALAQSTLNAPKKP